MPSYTRFAVKSDLEAFRKAVARDKKANTYDARAWDTKVLALLASACGDAEHCCERNATYTDRLRREAQGLLRDVEAKLKSLDVDQPLDKAVQTALTSSLASIHAFAKEARADNLRMRDALLAEYRGDGWTESAKAVLSDPKLVERFKLGRAKAIEMNKNAATLMSRCDEYTKRADEIIRQLMERARKPATGGADKLLQQARDAKHFAERLTKHSEAVFTIYDQLEDRMTQFEKVDPQKKTSDAELKLLRSRVANLQAELKNARGQFKTLRLMKEGFDEWERKSGIEGNGLIEDWMKHALPKVGKAYATAAEFAKREANLAKRLGKLLWD